jgi:hypothetical protein
MNIYSADDKVIDELECELAGETEVTDKTFPSATLSITNPTSPELW